MVKVSRLRVVAASVLTLALVACGPGAATSGTQPARGADAPARPASAPAAQDAAPQDTAPNAALQALIDGARREGQLVLIGGDGTFGGPEAIRRLADGYNRLYGLNV